MAGKEPRLIPLAKADEEGVEPGANTDILSSDITPSFNPSLLRIMVALDAAAKFSAVVTVSETEYSVAFNSGADLEAGCLYMFDLLVHSGDTVNFQIDSAETVSLLRVQEIVAGTQ